MVASSYASPKVPTMSLPIELKRLYKKGGGWRDLFDALAGYQKPMRELTAERASEISELAYETVVSGMKELAQLGVGEFRFGRRGGKTRIEWSYSPGSVGRVAQGRQDTLEAYAETEEEEADKAEDEPVTPPAAPLSVSSLIESAKRSLAAQLGVEPDRIDITIRY